jgi:hypothetical protein
MTNGKILFNVRTLNKDYHSGVKESNTQLSNTPIDINSLSFQDRIKALSSNAPKKGSIMVTGGTQTSNTICIHPTHINSVALMNDNLVTSDYSGFIKTLKVN